MLWAACGYAYWHIRTLERAQKTDRIASSGVFVCLYTSSPPFDYAYIWERVGFCGWRFDCQPKNHRIMPNTAMTYVLDYRHIKLMRILSFLHYLRIVFCAGLIIIRRLGIWQQSYEQTKQIHTPKQRTNRAAAPTGRKFYRIFVNTHTHTQNTRACVYEYEVECEVECARALASSASVLPPFFQWPFRTNRTHKHIIHHSTIDRAVTSESAVMQRINNFASWHVPQSALKQTRSVVVYRT